MNWDDRISGPIGLYNHCAHFDEQFTHIWDGFPLPVQKPTKWDMDAELVYSGKYKACVYKGEHVVGEHVVGDQCMCIAGHVAIAFSGVMLACSGPHPGMKCI